MFTKEKLSNDKISMYNSILKQLEALLEGVNDNIANLSNAAALLNVYLEDINWVGFYLNKTEELVLGPFQGMPACTKIKIGNGVCGMAAKNMETQLVNDVHQFPGHIACDSASNSEIVIPMIVNNNLFGVLDIDSPIFSRFDEIDKEYLEKFTDILESNIVKI